MTTDVLLKILEARGLRVEYVDGAPRLKGPKEAMTPRLVKVLKRHRPEIDRRMKPPATRRIVLLAGDAAERVLWEGPTSWGRDMLCRRLAHEHPGRNVAAEWWHGKRGVWVRYLVCCFPETPCPEA